MGYSHRELRAQRELRAIEGLAIAAIATLVAAGLYLPFPLDLLGGVGGLAALGAALSLLGGALLRSYESDVRRVGAAGGDARGAIVAEVRSHLSPGASLAGRGGKSPHARRPRAPPELPTGGSRAVAPAAPSLPPL